MTGDLELRVVRCMDEEHGYVAGFAVTDHVVVAVGGLSSQRPTVLASSDATHFADRTTPRRRGLRDALAVGDAIWVCGEYGQLAVSRDHGATWTVLDTGTESCLFALALATDGAIWVVGEHGYAARVLGDRPHRVDLGADDALLAAYAVRTAAAAPGELALLDAAGTLRRWREGRVTEIATGASKPLNALEITSQGTWIVVGDGGFLARSPNGTWFSRVRLDLETDLEGVVALPGAVVAVGASGVVLVSSDDGRTWGTVPHSLGAVHLWSVERFGGGALIGGDGGLIARLAPPGDTTWAGRPDRFAGAKVFESSLHDAPPAYLAAIAEEAEDEEDDDESDDDDDDDDDDDEEGEDDDEDEEDDDEDDDEDAEGDGAAFRVQRLSSLLGRTPRARWAELAWQWLDDGIAHRALLARLAHTEAAPQLAALAELSELPEDERAVAVPRLASELAPELEAILVGSLVRDDVLSGVLAGLPATSDDEDDDDDEDVEDLEPDDDDDDDDGPDAPGWQAIDRALAPIYGDTEPLHYGTVLPYMLGGNDPLHGISAYPRTEPVPHWHFVTYGFTDLFRKETDDPEESGFGFELTFRLARPLDEAQPPAWALNFLQNLARYVFGTGNRFAAGHKMGLNGPIALGHDTAITAVCFANDPELDEIESELGRARFVQIVGITEDEYRLIQEWSTPGLLEILRGKLPHLVTDLARRSVLEDPVTARAVEQRVAQEGSSEDLTFAGDMVLDADDGRVRIELGALYAAVLPRAMRGRIRHGRPYELRGRAAALLLRPASQNGYRREDDELVLEITQELAREIEARLRDTLVGEYRFETWPALTIRVTPSFIRAQDGTATEVRGIADPDEARAMLAEHNARIAAYDDEDDDDDPGDASEADGDGPDEPACDPLQLTRALALTERALRLAPDDADVQYTHAMFLIDAGCEPLADRIEELLAWLPRFSPSVRIAAAVRLAHEHHPRFAEAAELALAGGRPVACTEVGPDLLAELGDAILQHAPPKMARLVPVLPGDVGLLSELAWKAIQLAHQDIAMALYDRLLSLPIPDDGDERTNYLRAMNNACVQAHAAKAFETAARIADRAQPVAHENPYIFHSAACAYAALGEYGKALEQVRLAIEHDYDHVGKVEVDTDLGPLLEWPEFKALFRDWHARQESN